MKNREQLEAEMAPLQRALNKLRDAETRAQSQALVGKCFKYRNNYSCPSKPSDYWWLYIKVTGLSGTWPKTFEFQVDKYSRIEIKTDTTRIRPDGGYVEISSKEFADAWKRLQRRIATTKP
jgi:hypothetical protein